MDRAQIRLLSIILLVPFTALTAWAAYEYPGIGILEYQFATSAGLQVWIDLVIAMVLFLIWMFPDAKKHGRNPWPWVVITLTIGSFGPLIYLATWKAPVAEAA